MDECTKCDRLEREIQEMKIDIKEIYGKQYQNEIVINGTEIKLTAILQSIDKLMLKLDKLSDVPANRWNNLIGGIVLAIASAVISILIFRRWLYAKQTKK